MKNLLTLLMSCMCMLDELGFQKSPSKDKELPIHSLQILSRVYILLLNQGLFSFIHSSMASLNLHKDTAFLQQQVFQTSYFVLFC